MGSEYLCIIQKKKVLVKCLAIGDKLLVDAIAVGGTYPTAHLEIRCVIRLSLSLLFFFFIFLFVLLFSMCNFDVMIFFLFLRS